MHQTFNGDSLRGGDVRASLGLFEAVRNLHRGRIGLAEAGLVLWVWVAGAVSIALAAVIPVHLMHPDVIGGVTSKFLLTHENNLGAWWSGMLLLMLALHAYDSRVAWRSRSRDIAWAWGALSGIFFFFSADEISSIHERLSGVGRWIGVGPWPPLLVVAAVLGVIAMRALFILWRQGGMLRRQSVVIFIGLGMLGSVAIQEYIEHKLVLTSVWTQALRAVIEEGTELFGMMIILLAVVHGSIALARRSEPVFAFAARRGPRVLSFGFLMVPVFTALAMLIVDDRGQAANWLGSSVFLISSMLAISLLIAGGGAERRRLTAIAVLGICCSATSTGFGPFQTISIHGIEFGTRLLLLTPLAAASIVLWVARLAHVPATKPDLVAVACCAVLVLPAMAATPLVGYVLTQVLALSTFAVALLAVGVIAPHGERAEDFDHAPHLPGF